MTNSRMNPKVDEFLSKAKKWKEEYEKLRNIVLDCELTEEFKWMHPCYTFEEKNIVLIHGFKEYCALLFHKGALLQDAHGILIQQTENVQAARQIRFTEETLIGYLCCSEILWAHPPGSRGSGVLRSVAAERKARD